MTITTEIDLSRQLTIVTGTGELLFEDVLKAIRSFYQGVPTLNVLWDLSAATAKNITSKQVNQIVHMLQELRNAREGGKTAIVSPSNSTFGLARMLEMLLDATAETHHQVYMRVFRHMTEAVQWLTEEN